jgi:hypothetical protein
MNKVGSSRITGARQKKTIKYGDFEVEVASLFSDVSEIYNRTTLLSEKLLSAGCFQSSGQIASGQRQQRDRLVRSCDPGSAPSNTLFSTRTFVCSVSLR